MKALWYTVNFPDELGSAGCLVDCDGWLVQKLFVVRDFIPDTTRRINHIGPHRVFVDSLLNVWCFLYTSCLLPLSGTFKSVNAQFMNCVLPSVLWHCWLCIRKSIQPLKNWVLRYWHGYLSGARCKWSTYGPADAVATLSSLNPELFNLSSASLPRLSWKEAIKRFLSRIMSVAWHTVLWTQVYGHVCESPSFWFTWPSDHYFRSVCLSLCLFVCLFVCAEFFSAVWSDFNQTRIHVICLGLVVSPRV